MNHSKTTDQKVEPGPNRLLLYLALAVVFYFLSAGPVLSLAARVNCYGTPAYTFLRTLYSPVFFIARSSVPTTRAYEGYMRMWCRLMLPPGSPGT